MSSDLSEASYNDVLEKAAMIADAAAAKMDDVAAAHTDRVAKYHCECRAIEARSIAASIRGLKQRKPS